MLTQEQIEKKAEDFANGETHKNPINQSLEMGYIQGYKDAIKDIWRPIDEMKASSHMEDNTLLLFDDGSMRRFEEDLPFALSTHFFNPPKPE